MGSIGASGMLPMGSVGQTISVSLVPRSLPRTDLAPVSVLPLVRGSQGVAVRTDESEVLLRVVVRVSVDVVHLQRGRGTEPLCDPASGVLALVGASAEEVTTTRSIRGGVIKAPHLDVTSPTCGDAGVTPFVVPTSHSLPTSTLRQFLRTRDLVLIVVLCCTTPVTEVSKVSSLVGDGGITVGAVFWVSSVTAHRCFMLPFSTVLHVFLCFEVTLPVVLTHACSLIRLGSI